MAEHSLRDYRNKPEIEPKVGHVVTCHEEGCVVRFNLPNETTITEVDSLGKIFVLDKYGISVGPFFPGRFDLLSKSCLGSKVESLEWVLTFAGYNPMAIAAPTLIQAVELAKKDAHPVDRLVSVTIRQLTGDKT